MNKIYIEPRGSGKTTKLVYDLFDLIYRKQKVYFFCGSEQARRNIIYSIRQKVEAILSSRQSVPEHFKLERLNKIILVPSEVLNFRFSECTEDTYVLVDEYMMFNLNMKHTLYNLFYTQLRNATWTIRSTSNKWYRKEVLDLVRSVKENARYSTLDFHLRKFLNPMDLEDFNELWLNFISEPSFKIKSGQLDMEKQMSQDQYEIQMMGKFLLY